MKMWSSNVLSDNTNVPNNMNSLTNSEQKHNDLKDTQCLSTPKQQATRNTSLAESTKVPKNTRNTSIFWYVGAMVSCCYANLLSGGLMSSYGIMYTYMQESLGVSIYQLTWIGSLMAGFQGFTSLIATVLIDVFGCRVTVLIGAVFGSLGVTCSSLTSNIHVLYFTLGVLPGVGCCLSYNASMVHVSRMFTKWRPLATGLCVAGAAVGILAYPPLTTFMTEHFGWKGSLLLHGAFYLHLLPFALLVKHEPNKVSASKHEEKPSRPNTILIKVKNYLKVFQQVPVLLVALAHCFIGVANPTFATFIPEYVINGPLKLTPMDSALILSLSGFGSLFARVVFGGVASVHVKAPQIIYGTAILLCGVVELLVVLSRSGLQMMINGAVYGLVFGAWPSVACSVFVNLFGLENLSKTFGAFTFSQGIGSLCAPPLQSYLASLFNNQDIFFYIGGGSFVIAFLIIFIVLWSVTPFLWSRMSLKISPQPMQNGKYDSSTKVVTMKKPSCGVINEALEEGPS